MFFYFHISFVAKILATDIYIVLWNDHNNLCQCLPQVPNVFPSSSQFVPQDVKNRKN